MVWSTGRFVWRATRRLCPMKIFPPRVVGLGVLFCFVLASCGNDSGDKAELEQRVTQVPAKIYCAAEKVIQQKKFNATARLETQSGNIVASAGIHFQFIPQDNNVKWGCYAEGTLQQKLIRVSLIMTDQQLSDFITGYRECGHQPVPATIEIVDENDNGLYDPNVDTIRVISFYVPSCPPADGGGDPGTN